MTRVKPATVFCASCDEPLNPGEDCLSCNPPSNGEDKTQIIPIDKDKVISALQDQILDMETKIRAAEDVIRNYEYSIDAYKVRLKDKSNQVKNLSDKNKRLKRICDLLVSGHKTDQIKGLKTLVRFHMEEENDVRDSKE